MLGQLIEFNIFGDDRGSLVSFEENNNVPFDIKRVYYIYGTDTEVTRGKHAHKNLKQLAICVSGSCTFTLDDGQSKESYDLNSPNHGLLIEGAIWREMSSFSEDCVLMVLADSYYDESDYIRDYDVFLKLLNDED